MKKFKLFGIILGVFLIFIIGGAAIMYLTLSANMKEIKAIDINNIDFENIENGIYQGSYYYENQIGATLEIEIEDGEIINIEIIEHLYGLGGKAESLLDDILIEQTILVDDIAGATTSSHILKLAIQDALEEKE